MKFALGSLLCIAASLIVEISATRTHLHHSEKVKQIEKAFEREPNLSLKDEQGSCPGPHDKVTSCFDGTSYYVTMEYHPGDDGKCLKHFIIRKRQKCDPEKCGKSYLVAGGKCDATTNVRPVYLVYFVLKGNRCEKKKIENSQIECGTSLTCNKPKNSIGDCIGGVRRITAVSYTAQADRCVLEESLVSQSVCDDQKCGEDYEKYGPCNNGQQSFIKGYTNVVDGICVPTENERFYSCGSDSPSVRVSKKESSEGPCPGPHDKVTSCFSGSSYYFTMIYRQEGDKCLKSRDVKQTNSCDPDKCGPSYMYCTEQCDAGSNDKAIQLVYFVVEDDSCVQKEMEYSRIPCSQQYKCNKAKNSIGDCIDNVRQITAVSYVARGNQCVLTEKVLSQTKCDESQCGDDYEIFADCNNGQQRFVKGYSVLDDDGNCVQKEDERFYSC